MTATFPLAPMDRLMAGFTWFAMAIPTLFVGIALVAPFPVSLTLLGSGGAVAAMYAGVWFLARPTRFEVDGDALRVVFPTWTATIPRASLGEVTLHAGDAFKREIGWGLRVGVGGLWGGFGWLYTPKGRLVMAISRTTDLVVIQGVGRDDLLLSPADPARFVEALSAG